MRGSGRSYGIFSEVGGVDVMLDVFGDGKGVSIPLVLGSPHLETWSGL